MRRSVPLLALLLASCAAPPTPVQIIAESPPVARCVSPERIKASAPADVRIAEISSPAAFLSALNAIPPRTDARADRIIVARVGEAGRIFLFDQGCLIAYSDLPWEMVMMLMGEGA